MTCPIKHALDQCQLALGRVQQRQPQAGYTFTAAYEAISAAREELARLRAQSEGGRTVPTELLVRVQQSLGDFVSGHDWSQADMDTSDDLNGLLAGRA